MQILIYPSMASVVVILVSEAVRFLFRWKRNVYRWVMPAVVAVAYLVGMVCGFVVWAINQPVGDAAGDYIIFLPFMAFPILAVGYGIGVLAERIATSVLSKLDRGAQ